MAVLQQHTSSGNGSLFDTPASRDPMPPAGTFRATILDIADKFGVERPKFDNPGEMEIVDLTQFRFGFTAKGAKYTIDSRKLKISSHEKAALMGLLTQILGAPPRMPYDYAELKGRQVLITVAHVEGKSMTFARIVSVSPLPDEDEQPAPARKADTREARGRADDIPF